MLKRYFIVIVLIVLLLGGLFGFKFYQIHQVTSHMPPPPPAMVAATTVQQEQWQSSLSAIGSLTAVASIDVSTEVAGIVKAIHFDSGHTVKQGQLLVELDASTEIAELQGFLAEQQLARLRFDRSSKMIEKKFISAADLDLHRAQLDQAIAAVSSKRAVLEKKQIRAPFSGELGMRQVDLGRFLDKGAAIVSLQQLDPIFLDFTLPERHVGKLVKDQTISVTVQAYPGRSFTGRIQAINPSLEQNSRSLKLRASLENHDKSLHPGMFAQVQIASGQATPVLTLPDTAITYNPYGNSVYLIVQAEHGLSVQSRQIETGASRNGRVEIISGINAGDRVVSAGQVKLRNGMPIVIDDKPAPGEREPTR
jgi:membrane fusion protein (multidrug efflux system)